MSDRDDTKPRCAGVDRASGFCNIILWKEKNRRSKGEKASWAVQCCSQEAF